MSILRVRKPDGTVVDIPVLQGPPGPAGSGSGDMVASVYDPQGRATDIFAYVDAALGSYINEVDALIGGDG